MPLANLSVFSSTDLQQGDALLVSFKKHMKTCSVGARERIDASNLLWEPQKKKTQTKQTNPQQNYIKWQQAFHPLSILTSLTLLSVFVTFCSPFLLPTLCAVLYLYTAEYISRDLNTACFSQLLMNLRSSHESKFKFHLTCLFFGSCLHFFPTVPTKQPCAGKYNN